MGKIKTGFYLKNEMYEAYFYMTEKGYCYIQREDFPKPRRISQESYENRLAEKNNW